MLYCIFAQQFKIVFNVFIYAHINYNYIHKKLGLQIWLTNSYNYQTIQLMLKRRKKNSSQEPDVKMAAILQLSQYCTFKMDSISTVITEQGQPVTSRRAKKSPSPLSRYLTVIFCTVNIMRIQSYVHENNMKLL